MTPSPQVELGAQIRRLRTERGLSQRAFTRLIGLSAHSNLADYETGRRLPPADIVAECERALGITDGQLARLHADALVQRANPPAAGVTAAATDRPIRWRTRRVQASLAAAVVIAAVVLGLTTLHADASSAAHPRTPEASQLALHTSAVALSPNGTPLLDGLDPRQSGCAPDAVTLDSVELRLPRAATVNNHTLPAGWVVGHVTLRYSPACRMAWARVDPAPDVDTPPAGTVDVYATRSSDGTRAAFHLGHLEEAYGDMLLTTACVRAEGSISFTGGPVVTATTRCLPDPSTRG